MPTPEIEFISLVILQDPASKYFFLELVLHEYLMAPTLLFSTYICSEGIWDKNFCLIRVGNIESINNKITFTSRV